MGGTTRDTEQNALQGRAVRRLAVAAALVGVAVVALSILSHQKTAPPPVTPPPTIPQETMRSIEIAPPVPTPPVPTPPVPTPPVPTPPVPTPPVPTPPVPLTGVPTAPPPPPRVINRVTTPVKKPHKSLYRQNLRTVPEYYASPTRESPPVVTHKTAHQISSITPPIAPPLPAPHGYVVQLGVFSDYHNAIDLQKRLAQHGIKSYTETRLNLGPFHSKMAAEQSMIKLRRLGISAVVVPNH